MHILTEQPHSRLHGQWHWVLWLFSVSDLFHIFIYMHVMNIFTIPNLIQIYNIISLFPFFYITSKGMLVWYTASMLPVSMTHCLQVRYLSSHARTMPIFHASMIPSKQAGFFKAKGLCRQGRVVGSLHGIQLHIAHNSLEANKSSFCFCWSSFTNLKETKMVNYHSSYVLQYTAAMTFYHKHKFNDYINTHSCAVSARISGPTKGLHTCTFVHVCCSCVAKYTMYTPCGYEDTANNLGCVLIATHINILHSQEGVCHCKGLSHRQFKKKNPGMVFFASDL